LLVQDCVKGQKSGPPILLYQAMVVCPIRPGIGWTRYLILKLIISCDSTDESGNIYLN